MTKMSDVFDLPLRTGQGEVWDDVLDARGVHVAQDVIESDAIVQAVNAHDQLVEALEFIVNWQLPQATLSSGETCSYGSAYGSNGERDYMRKVAQQALAAAKGEA